MSALPPPLYPRKRHWMRTLRTSSLCQKRTSVVATPTEACLFEINADPVGGAPSDMAIALFRFRLDLKREVVGDTNGASTSKQAPVSDKLRTTQSTVDATPNMVDPPLRVRTRGLARFSIISLHYNSLLGVSQ
jgi:hypothetical protein